MAHRYIVLNEDERAALFERVAGQGGFQSFLRRLQNQYRSGSQDLRLEVKDLEDIPHFAFDFKQGGWQERLKRIFESNLGPNLGRED